LDKLLTCPKWKCRAKVCSCFGPWCNLLHIWCNLLHISPYETSFAI